MAKKRKQKTYTKKDIEHEKRLGERIGQFRMLFWLVDKGYIGDRGLIRVLLEKFDEEMDC